MIRERVHKVVEAMKVPGMTGVFVLGSFERRVTFYSQQVRALNLADALISLGRLGPGKHVAVVGGGLAGLTFAAAIARRGVEVTLLEKQDRPLSLLRHKPKRWLHPRVYDWPMPGWNHTGAGLPVLDWEAGTVEEVAKQLEAGWKAILTQHGALIHEHYRAREVRFRPQGDGVWVSWNEISSSGKTKPNGDAFALVVLAVGFGLERGEVPEYRGYWEPDDLDVDAGFILGKTPPQTWFISGAGDGALTDLLRLCISGFRHEHMVRDFVSDPQIEGVVRQIRAIEEDPRALDTDQPAFLHKAYEKLEVPFVVDLIRARPRPDTQVTLNAAKPFYLRVGSSVLNRFLVSQLRHAEGFSFVPGEFLSARSERGKLRVEFKDAPMMLVDRVVLRHGPRPAAVEEHFPDVWEACKAVRERWKQAPNLLDQTRERYWDKGVFGPEDRPEDTPPHAAAPPKSAAAARTPRTWRPHFAHALEPAKHFQGRHALVTELSTWLGDPASPARVFALCAPGGTGKTAIVEHGLNNWLQRHHVAGLPPAGGLFVWSFYENTRIEDFLGEACAYFLGDAGQVSGRFERLLSELQRGEPHLLVLDGLETVQAPGGDFRARGELEDRQLKRLVSLIASKNLGWTRLLVTSRFPLSELRDLAEPGRYREHLLEDLEPAAALELLRAWGVLGSEAVLDKLAEKVGRHALSVRVLGAYLAQFANGDPTVGLSLDLEETLKDASGSDPKAAKLARLLAHYAKAMKPEERELMARLSMFPRGVAVSIIAVVVKAGGQVAGALASYKELQILQCLERLVIQGLAFGYGTLRQRVYTAHPFVRDTFRTLAGVPAEAVHEAVRSQLAPTLKGQPGWPQDPESLDRYETLIEHTLLAGKIVEAFELYAYSLSGYENLGKRLGDYTRINRILTGFTTHSARLLYSGPLTPRQRSNIAATLGLSAINVGDIPTAQHYLALSSAIDRQQGDVDFLVGDLRNNAELECIQGRLPQALTHAEEAVVNVGKIRYERETTTAACHAEFAWMCVLMGNVKAGRTHFATAQRLEKKPLDHLSGLYEAKTRWLLGDHAGAQAQSLANLLICKKREWFRVLARFHALLGQLALPKDLEEARRYLELTRDWTQRSGEMELILWAHLLAAEIASVTGNPQEALAEAERGRVQADACGFGLYAIDLRLTAARIYLSQGNARDALRYTEEVLGKASHPDCGYVWGQADAEHLAGYALRALNQDEAARARFQSAAEIRERIQHPGAAESRAMSIGKMKTLLRGGAPGQAG